MCGMMVFEAYKLDSGVVKNTNSSRSKVGTDEQFLTGKRRTKVRQCCFCAKTLT